MIDIGDALLAAINEFITALFVTIPSAFFSTALDGGVFFNIFFELFGSAALFQALFILALVSGPWMWIRSLNKGHRSSQDLTRRQK